MKKFLKVFLILALFLFPLGIKAENEVDLYLFYSDTCPHCHAELEALEILEEKYPNLVIHKYEMSSDFSATSYYNELGEHFQIQLSGVPFTVIGDKYWSGFSEGNEDDFEKYIKKYEGTNYNDPAGIITGNKFGELIFNRETINEVDLGWFGTYGSNEFALPTITILIGIVDGFNPCAMWILLFLISMLIGEKDKKRMWTLGLTFIVTSAVVYFAFLAAWFNVIEIMDTMRWFKIAVGGFAIGAGMYSLYKFSQQKDDGCDVVEEKQRSKLFDRVTRVVKENSLLYACVGIAVLAVIVNLIELACSTGLPATFALLLEANDLTSIQNYGYMALYVLFFMIDDIIIFAIAMYTMKITGISAKYSKYTKLIGGIIMLVIGMLLLYAPHLLSF